MWVAGSGKAPYTSPRRTLSGFRRPHRLAVRTSPFHGEDRGSIPRGDAKRELSASPRARRQTRRPRLLPGVRGRYCPLGVQAIAVGSFAQTLHAHAQMRQPRADPRRWEPRAGIFPDVIDEKRGINMRARRAAVAVAKEAGRTRESCRRCYGRNIGRWLNSAASRRDPANRPTAQAQSFPRRAEIRRHSSSRMKCLVRSKTSRS